MLNNGIIRNWEYGGSPKQIVVNSMHTKRVGCIVDAAAANGTVNGISVVLAGTPLTVDLKDRQTPGTLTTSGMPTGVLIHDVPVGGDYGDGNGSLLIDGSILYEYCDPAVQTLIDATDLITEESQIKVITKK